MRSLFRELPPVTDPEAVVQPKKNHQEDQISSQVQPLNVQTAIRVVYPSESQDGTVVSDMINSNTMSYS